MLSRCFISVAEWNGNFIAALTTIDFFGPNLLASLNDIKIHNILLCVVHYQCTSGRKTTGSWMQTDIGSNVRVLPPKNFVNLGHYLTTSNFFILELGIIMPVLLVWF